MNAHKLISWSPRHTMYWGVICAGLALVIWQFFTLMDVMEGHTAQAQKISQSASWAGHPVGTMPQTDITGSEGMMTVQHANTIGVGRMKVDLP